MRCKLQSSFMELLQLFRRSSQYLQIITIFFIRNCYNRFWKIFFWFQLNFLYRIATYTERNMIYSLELQSFLIGIATIYIVHFFSQAIIQSFLYRNCTCTTGSTNIPPYLQSFLYRNCTITYYY